MKIDSLASKTGYYVPNESWSVTWNITKITSVRKTDPPTKGTATGTKVTSTSKNGYPNNGISGNLWYVYSGVE